jgi:uncharacterized LabA/DUF88 family protein
MEKEKVVFFLDYANTSRSAREKRYHLDYHDLLQYIGENRFLIDAHCYVPINPRNEHRLDGEIEELWRSGYIVSTKVGTIVNGTYTCNFDVEITTDILKVAYQVKPDIIVLATSNPDFVPLIQEVRKSGVRIEVAAFVEAAGIDILLKCSGFIDLAVYYEGYLVAQHDEQSEDRTEERYKDLIQSQNGEQDEDDTGEQDEDPLQSRNSDLNEDDAKFSGDQLDDQTHVPVSDILDELGL